MFDEAHSAILSLLPQEQINEVMNTQLVDIDMSFLGFLNVYYNLSKLIPTHFTIIDFGCAYNPQCFFFSSHKKYIAIDSFPNIKVFKSKNCDFYNMETADFIEKIFPSFNFDIQQVFAICSYVSPWGRRNTEDIVRENFKNMFIYYPHGENEIIMKKTYLENKNENSI